MPSYHSWRGTDSSILLALSVTEHPRCEIIMVVEPLIKVSTNVDKVFAGLGWLMPHSLLHKPWKYTCRKRD